MIDVEAYWTKKYNQGKDSGWGSRKKSSLLFKSNYINDVISDGGVKTVCELGCGDGVQLSYFSGYSSYLGYDIASSAVERCRLKFDGDDTKEFTHDINSVISKKYDMALSLDVIYHLLGEDMYREHLHNLFLISDIVGIYSTNSEEPSIAPSVKNRIFTNDVNPEFRLIDTRPFPVLPFISFYLYKRDR